MSLLTPHITLRHSNPLISRPLHRSTTHLHYFQLNRLFILYLVVVIEEGLGVGVFEICSDRSVIHFVAICEIGSHPAEFLAVGRTPTISVLREGRSKVFTAVGRLEDSIPRPQPYRFPFPFLLICP